MWHGSDGVCPETGAEASSVVAAAVWGEAAEKGGWNYPISDLLKFWESLVAFHAYGDFVHLHC